MSTYPPEHIPYVEPLDLKAVAEAALEEYRHERAAAIRQKIKHIVGKVSAGRGSVTDLERQLEKAKERLAKEENKLDQVLKGNWSVLREDEREDV